jgi:alpha-galactosidase
MLNTKYDVQNWVDANFSENKVPPFSFTYGGKHSNTFITGWNFTSEKLTSKDTNIIEYVYTYSKPNGGLLVKCYVTCYIDFPSVEWVLKISNISSSNSQIIENLDVVNHVFNFKKEGTFILHHSNGSFRDRSDFRPYEDALSIGKSIYMTPNGGRSSGGGATAGGGVTAFPFFNVESPADAGILVSIGWTGKWYADVRQTDKKSVLIKSGMEKVHLFLYPKEEIRSPRICLLFWKGADRMTGHNQFRRFILAHHTRKINEKPSELPFSLSLGGGGPYPCNGGCATESWLIASINRYKQFGIIPEAFWLDAGWYPNYGDWHNTGTWNPNKDNFPNGLKPISDAAHSLGAKFLVWFEPERVRAKTELADEHPEWLLEIPDSPNKLLNLGNKDALTWVTNRISDMIIKDGIDIYRQDFNMDPYPYWERNDLPDRVGISEIRHIEGLYMFWDSLLVRFPNLIIDNCSSGGRRIDLETISRSSPFYRTDFKSYEQPNGSQDQTYGLNFYLPLHGTSSHIMTKYYFRSNISSTMVVGWNIDLYSQSEMQKYIQDFKRLRPYFYGDYYPLTGINNILKDNTWLVYQLNRPEQGDGVIFAFRREGNREESIQIQLKGIDANARYELFYEDYDMIIKKTGDELIRGIKITIPTNPASLLISYRRV